MAVKYPDPHRTLKRGHRGRDVEAFQAGLNARLEEVPAHLRVSFERKLKVDGDFGPATMLAWREVRNAIGLPAWLRPTKRAQTNVRRPQTRSANAVRRAQARRKPPKAPLRELAYQQAARRVGVMEQGGNNVGAAVEWIIALGGGLRGQAWCGWFCAAMYRLAGSKAVSWQWGAVRLYVPLSGISRTSTPERGDLVRFTFDHIGMFVRDLGNGEIETIEGNTGASGAVSDSTTGGDGVYRKRRSKTLVRDYLRVTR